MQTPGKIPGVFLLSKQIKKNKMTITTDINNNSEIKSALWAYYLFLLDNNPELPKNNEKAEKLFTEYERLKNESLSLEKSR